MYKMKPYLRPCIDLEGVDAKPEIRSYKGRLLFTLPTSPCGKQKDNFTDKDGYLVMGLRERLKNPPKQGYPWQPDGVPLHTAPSSKLPRHFAFNQWRDMWAQPVEGYIGDGPTRGSNLLRDMCARPKVTAFAQDDQPESEPVLFDGICCRSDIPTDDDTLKNVDADIRKGYPGRIKPVVLSSEVEQPLLEDVMRIEGLLQDADQPYQGESEDDGEIHTEFDDNDDNDDSDNWSMSEEPVDLKEEHRKLYRRIWGSLHKWRTRTMVVRLKIVARRFYRIHWRHSWDACKGFIKPMRNRSLGWQAKSRSMSISETVQKCYEEAWELFMASLDERIAKLEKDPPVRESRWQRPPSNGGINAYASYPGGRYVVEYTKDGQVAKSVKWNSGPAHWLAGANHLFEMNPLNQWPETETETSEDDLSTRDSNRIREKYRVTATVLRGEEVGEVRVDAPGRPGERLQDHEPLRQLVAALERTLAKAKTKASKRKAEKALVEVKARLSDDVPNKRPYMLHFKVKQSSNAMKRNQDTNERKREQLDLADKRSEITGDAARGKQFDKDRGGLRALRKPWQSKTAVSIPVPEGMTDADLGKYHQVFEYNRMKAYAAKMDELPAKGRIGIREYLHAWEGQRSPEPVIIMRVEHTGQAVKLKTSYLSDEAKCERRDGGRVYLKRNGITLIPVPYAERRCRECVAEYISKHYKDWVADRVFPHPAAMRREITAAELEEDYAPVGGWRPVDDARELEGLRRSVRQSEWAEARRLTYRAVPVKEGEVVEDPPSGRYRPAESLSDSREGRLSTYQVWASFPRLEPGGPPDQPFERFTAGEAARSRHGGRKNSLEVHWLPRPVDTKTGKPVEIPNPYRRDRKYTPGEAVLEYLARPRKSEWTVSEAPISKPWPLHEQQGFGPVTLDNFDQEVEE